MRPEASKGHGHLVWKGDFTLPQDEEGGKKDLKTQYTLEITPEGVITGTNDSVLVSKDNAEGSLEGKLCWMADDTTGVVRWREERQPPSEKVGLLAVSHWEVSGKMSRVGATEPPTFAITAEYRSMHGSGKIRLCSTGPPRVVGRGSL
jgi:hypothetical protein